MIEYIDPETGDVLWEEPELNEKQSSEVSTSDLLDCPFCGGKADYYQDKGSYTGQPVWSVGCKTENCFGYVSMTEFARKTDAQKAWNKRADNAEVSNRVSEERTNEI